MVYIYVNFINIFYDKELVTLKYFYISTLWLINKSYYNILLNYLYIYFYSKLTFKFI